ncbi:hypothetical protein TNCV_656651 [Trichonephila clavipes]|nr:hypothetical protein TNCV_656651 [Trichonephila clavipes]
MGTTNQRRTLGHKRSLISENRDKSSRREDDAPDKRRVQTNARTWSSMVALKKPIAWGRKRCLVGESRGKSSHRANDAPGGRSDQTNARTWSSMVTLKKPVRMQIFLSQQSFRWSTTH